MIARTHRFHGHGSLRFVYQNGQVERGPCMVLKYAHNKRRNTWRAAVVVSKKVHKSAVVRNRIRRRIYELLRVQLSSLEEPIDVVCIIHSESVASMPAVDLEQTVTQQLKKANLIRAIVDPKE